MKSLVFRLGAALSAAAFFAPGASAQTTFPLDPRGTYLRTSSDSSTDPRIIEVASLKVVPGDLIRLTITGTYQLTADPARQANFTVAVFSSTDTILAPDQPHRVPGAIAAGVPYVTAPTLFGGLPTDIPEDFLVASGGLHAVNVRVPEGAVVLIVCAADSLYFDNVDPEGDYGVSIASECLADFNLDGTVNSTDVSDFINAWFQDQVDGTPVTDWDVNGVVNSTDVSEFINQWFTDIAAGCGG